MRTTTISLVFLLVMSVSLPFAGAQADPTEMARRHLESGYQFYNQGRYKQALNDFQIIVTSMADTASADDALLKIGEY